MTGAAASAPAEVAAALARLGLVAEGASATFERLAGGVSSDIWKVTAGGRELCVKRALARLKVTQDWRAPVERSRYEHDWLAVARRFAPDAVGEVLGYDADARLIALRYYDPAYHRLWKSELRDGRVDPAIAAEVAAALVAIHNGTAGDPAVRDMFPTDAIFHAIRLEPYLLATAHVHPDLAARLEALAQTTAETKRCLVHGDVSPKNILIGPRGPILLDAECAWYGDPAFDVAFCLNHLLLKCLWSPPEDRDALLASFALLAETYLERVRFEPADVLEARIAGLLPGLFLARIDGKSPVEYLTEDAPKNKVRRIARHFLASPVSRVEPIWSAWAAEITA